MPIARNSNEFQGMDVSLTDNPWLNRWWCRWVDVNGHPDSYALLSEIYLIRGFKRSLQLDGILYLIRREQKPIPLLWHDMRYLIVPHYKRKLDALQQGAIGLVHLGSSERT